MKFENKEEICYRKKSHARPRTILLVFIVFGLICLVSAPVLAQKKLKIVGGDYPPFKYKKDGKAVGSDTEIIEQVLVRMGYHPKMQLLPWKRAIHGVKEGLYTAYFTLTINPEREKVLYFTDPISTWSDVFYKRKADKISWETMEDLSQYRVSASEGYNYPSLFKEAVKAKTFKVQFVVGKRPELQQLGKLVFGRVDLFICEVSVCQYYIRTNAPEFKTLDFIDRPIGVVRTSQLGISKKWPNAEQLKNQFNAELAKFVAEGRRKEIFKKYGILSKLK